MFIPDLDAFKKKFDSRFDFNKVTRELLMESEGRPHVIESPNLAYGFLTHDEADELVSTLESKVFGKRRPLQTVAQTEKRPRKPTDPRKLQRRARYYYAGAAYARYQGRLQEAKEQQVRAYAASSRTRELLGLKPEDYLC